MGWPIASICVARPIATALREVGSDPSSIFQQFGLGISSLESPDATISFRDYTSLIKLAAHETQNPHFGLQMGQKSDIRNYGAFGIRLFYSKSIGEGISFLTAFTKCILQSAHVEIRSLGHTNLLTLDFMDSDGQTLGLVTETWLAFYVRWIRQTHRPSWEPLKVYFRCPQPKNIDRIKQYFRAPILFNHDFDGLEFTNGTLDTTLTNYDLELCNVLEVYLKKQSEKWPSWRDLKSVVSTEIKQALEANEAQIDKMAKRLGYSTRTFQRHLKADGIEYENLVETVRSRTALSMLEQDGKTISDISFALGYADVSSFSRAFLRWHGIPPLKYRQAQERKLVGNQ